MKASTNFASALNATLVSNGTAAITFDTQAWGVTLSGNLTGDGGLNKTGTGTLTLSGNNTYAGPTRVLQGRLVRDVDVRLNRAVVEHDVTLILGPVFPHEVVGFSGGNKYLFPGVAVKDVIDPTGILNPGKLLPANSMVELPA